MKRRYELPERPYGRLDLHYVGAGRAGACYRRDDGLEVRLAAPEREPPVQRERLSVLGLMLALLASGERPR